MPFDDTIPQKTEGDEYMTLAITPTHASNILYIDVIANASHSAVSFFSTAALFQDTTAGALAAVSAYTANATGGQNLAMKHKMTAGTTSATTFKVRIGSSNAGTTSFNAESAARRYGGVFSSTITITEISA